MGDKPVNGAEYPIEHSATALYPCPRIPLTKRERSAAARMAHYPRSRAAALEGTLSRLPDLAIESSAHNSRRHRRRQATTLRFLREFTFVQVLIRLVRLA